MCPHSNWKTEGGGDLQKADSINVVRHIIRLLNISLRSHCNRKVQQMLAKFLTLNFTGIIKLGFSKLTSWTIFKMILQICHSCSLWFRKSTSCFLFLVQIILWSVLTSKNSFLFLFVFVLKMGFLAFWNTALRFGFYVTDWAGSHSSFAMDFS